MRPVFDGHNDALTKPDHAELVSGRPGGWRGGIFSVFIESRRERKRPLPRSDDLIEFELAPAVSHQRAAAEASAVAGRLLALEADGHVRLARPIADFDAALADAGPPLAVLHLEGAEAIDPALEALDTWYAAGLRSLGPV